MPPKAKTSTAKKATTSKAASLSGKIHHTFYGVPEMDMVGERTDIEIIGGYPWRLWMCRYGGGQHQIHIECLQSEETPVWHCDFDYKITIHDQGYGCRFVEQDEVTVSQSQWLTRAKQLDRFMDKNQNEDGDMVDYVDVEVDIMVKEAKGNRFRPRPSIDIFTPDEQMYNYTLAIGDKKIQVNKQFLSFHSVFFKDLFGMNKKGEEKEATVIGVEPEDFAMLLGYLYRMEGMAKSGCNLTMDLITVDNYDTLAKMAIQFQIQEMKDGVEYFLMDHYEVTVWSEEKKLQTAEKYGMESYKEITLEEINHEYNIEKIKKTREYKGFSKELKQRIEKRAEDIKKEKAKK